MAIHTTSDTVQYRENGTVFNRSQLAATPAQRSMTVEQIFARQGEIDLLPRQEDGLFDDTVMLELDQLQDALVVIGYDPEA